MICILAENYQEAWVWARGQMLAKDEWFFPSKLQDLYGRNNFHVIVASVTTHADFELMYRIARERGRINRK